MFQRIQRNPKHYSVGKNDDQTWEERMDDLVLQSVQRLKETQLVEYSDSDPKGRLTSTEFGDIMTKVCHIFIVTFLLTCFIVLPSPSHGKPPDLYPLCLIQDSIDGLDFGFT